MRASSTIPVDHEGLDEPERWDRLSEFLHRVLEWQTDCLKQSNRRNRFRTCAVMNVASMYCLAPAMLGRSIGQISREFGVSKQAVSKRIAEFRARTGIKMPAPAGWNHLEKR
jgi:hypothetical protein